jgi:hypothetical protein
VEVNDPINKEYMIGIQGERFSDGSFIPGPWDTTDNPFLIALSSIPTQTATLVNAPTSVPVCSKLAVMGTNISGTDFNVIVKNENTSSAFLTNAEISWPAYPGMTFDNARFSGNTYYNTDSTTSSVVAPAPMIEMNGGSYGHTFRARFKDAVNMTGLFSVQLTFNFPGVGDCILTGTINPSTITPTLTPENTPQPSETPTVTPTVVDTDTPTPTLVIITSTPTSTITITPTRTVTPTRTKTATPACSDC